MIQVVITIADDPKDGETGVRVDRRGEAKSINEAYLGHCLAEEVMSSLKRVSERMMAAGNVSHVVEFTGEALQREGRAFGERLTKEGGGA